MYTDPISDYLTRLRNALKARKRSVEVPASNMKKRISEILKNNGYIDDYQVVSTPEKQGRIVIKLKYYNDESVILGLERVSKPGIRKYVDRKELPRVLNGLGIAIISTSHGLMTDKEARKQGLGGEVLCNVW
jgi:small subunit ribosomal protein S8